MNQKEDIMSKLVTVLTKLLQLATPIVEDKLDKLDKWVDSKSKPT
jgi:hypothetical protein